MKRKNKRRRRNSKPSLSFARLEPRQLLAGDIVANLVTNGDFSTFTTQTSPLFSQDDVAGWNAANDADGQQLALFTFNIDNGTALKLDSTDQHDDRIFQDIDTESGSSYLLSFEVKGQTPSESSTVADDVEVFWDGQSVGTFQSNFFWQNFTIQVDGAATDLSRLEFREVVTSENPFGDSVGVLIDNVCVFEVEAITVENGSFESSTGDGPFFTNGNVDGWNAIAREGEARLIKLQGASDAATVPDGAQFFNLDTTGTHLDHVYNDIDTSVSRDYYVVFDMRADGPQDENPDQLRVRWKASGVDVSSDQWVGTFQGNENWQTYGVYVESAGELSRLEFREPGGLSGDGSGPLIDNVRVFEVVGNNVSVNDLKVDVNGAADATERGSAEYMLGSTSQLLTPLIELSHDSNDELTSATVQIVNSADSTGESLSVNVGSTGLTADFIASTGALTISGAATVNQYQDVLRTLRYRNVSNGIDTTPREISIVITDSSIDGSDNTSIAGFVDMTFESNQLALAAISDVTVESGSPLWVPLSLDNLADGPVTFTAEVGDASLATPFFADGQSLRVSVDAPDAVTNGVASPISGDLVFQLFEDLAPRPTERVISLANSGFYDGVEFHRISPGFVIQGGDPTASGSGGSTLGDFDDQFNVDLQHNQAGLLSFAKSTDDTNDSQFFITSTDTRSLDFNHSIFGVLTEGEELRQAIAAVDTTANPNLPVDLEQEYPIGGITMTNVEAFDDNQNSALLVRVPEGAIGSTTMTVTATDLSGNSVSQTFTVNIAPPTNAFSNANPFLEDIPTINAINNVERTFQLSALDVEDDDVVFLDKEAIDAINALISDPRLLVRFPTGVVLGHDSFEYSVDGSTGLVTLTPGPGGVSPEVVNIVVAVAPAGQGVDSRNIDFQIVPINISNGLSAFDPN
jgi:cyclophilin family peptidyl-prolyl cis-trans isomerase